MADDDETTSSGDTGQDPSSAGITLHLSEFPAIAQALQFSSSDQMLASLGVNPSGSDDTATA